MIRAMQHKKATMKLMKFGALALAVLCCASAEAQQRIKPFPEFSKARALTTGPHDHFFANYFAINPWSPDNRYALVLETDLKDKLPDGTPCTLGLVDTEDGNKFIPVTTTRCWNFQEAAMAHWLPWAKDTFVFNDIRDGKFCAVVMNWKTKKERHFPYPVSAVSEDGEWAISINYARLFITRPDYGYYGGGQDPRKGVVFPEDDGLWRVNMRTGEAKLIVPTAAVKDLVPAVNSPEGMSYLCHTVISKDNKRIYFLSRSVEESFEGVKKFKGVKWQTTAFTCNADGTGIRRCFPDGWGSSHFNWKPAFTERDGRTMVVTANFQTRAYTHVEFTVGEEGRARQLGGKAMDFDGHCIYTPDGEFISGDGYFDKKGFRHWKMLRLADNAIKDLGDWWTPEIYRDIYCRCDLHPRWRPDGLQIGFNSVHEGSRQVYVMDVVKNPPVRRPALIPMPRKVEWKVGKCPPGAAVSKTRDPSIPTEGYRLDVTPKGIAIASSDDAGAFYAEKTLAQLKLKGGDCPCVSIEDAPAFRWRGALLDEGRHFFGKETVKRMIDLLADYKFNVFHWHLTEDQGWRIDVPGLPELAKRGAMREQSPCHGARLKKVAPYDYRSSALNGEKYGPFFYTEADLREIVAYAKERHVTVVPEIELPGHAYGALAAYPNLACFPERIGKAAASDWGIFRDVFCVGNDETVAFLEKVLDFVCDVFPSEVIHIGGDECPRVIWKECPKCQARMKAEGLKTEGELQAWITKKMAAHLAKRGRRVMGWDEILAGDVPTTAIGQSWRTNAKEGAGTEHVSAAAGALRGYDMVMSPHNLTYYSAPQGIENDPFLRGGGSLTLEKAYGFDPLAGVPESARSHVLGGQCCLWGEYLWNFFDLNWRMWPRAFAMSEVLWTYPSTRDFPAFEERAGEHRVRLLKQGINCAPLK